MSYNIDNTGYERATTLTVRRKTGEKIIWETTYYISREFKNYTEIKEADLVTMIDTDFEKRLMAFVVFVQEIELGATIDSSAARRENLGNCPIIKETEVNRIILEIHRTFIMDEMMYAPIYLKSDFPLLSDLTIKIGVKIDGSSMPIIEISAKKGDTLNKTINYPDEALVTEITEFLIITPSSEYDQYYDAKIVEI